MTLELAVTRHGSGDARAITWIGSLGSTTAMWQPQLAAFSSVANNLLVDLPGHGASPTTTRQVTIDDLAEGVAAALDRHGAERTHVVGLSIGAMIAMAFAAHHPGRVDRLGLLCTSAMLGPPGGWLDRAATVRSGGTRAVAAAVVDRWLTPSYAAAHPDQAAAFVEMVSSTDADGYAACCEAIAVMDLRGDLAAIVAPTLVIAGSADPATPPAHGTQIASLIPNARVDVVDGAHLASWECASEVNDLLAVHLQAKHLQDGGG